MSKEFEIMFGRFIRKLMGRVTERFFSQSDAGYNGVSSVSSAVYDEPEIELLTLEEPAVVIPAKVILYNDEVHTFDEVIVQLIKAIACPTYEAEKIAYEVDARGLACVFEGAMDECLRVSSVLEEIALHTSIEC